MSREEIITTTNRFLSEEFEVNSADITPDSNLKETLGLDSLDYVDLVVVIEENFNFKITLEDFKDIVTFEDFYQWVERKKASKAA
jgi:acyl carrier protein